jgi:hypothetical protein
VICRKATLALVVLALVGCGSNHATATPKNSATPVSQKETAAHFVVRVNKYLRDGQFGRAWNVLHPLQRKRVTAEKFAGCWPRDPADTPNAEYRVRAVYPEQWSVAGSPGQRPATAVTVAVISRAALENGEPVESEVSRFTQHAFRVRGRWAWILSPSALRACIPPS